MLAAAMPGEAHDKVQRVDLLVEKSNAAVPCASRVHGEEQAQTTFQVHIRTIMTISSNNPK
jgi:hypothetical protein